MNVYLDVIKSATRTFLSDFEQQCIRHLHDYDFMVVVSLT